MACSQQAQRLNRGSVQALEHCLAVGAQLRVPDADGDRPEIRETPRARHDVRRRLRGSRLLVRDEEEEAILDQRSADRALGHYAPEIYYRDGPAVPSPRDRPWTVNLCVALMGCFWAFVVALPVLEEGAASAPSWTIVLWTAVIVLWLSRVWAGGVLALTAAFTLSRLIGVIGLVAMALYAFTTFTSPYRSRA